jgi:hypothetical protein
MLELLVIAAVAAAAPAPGELKTFKDWTVGCDNGLACQAVALMPKNNFETATLVIKRGPEANAPLEAWFNVREGAPAAVEIDARRVPLVALKDGGYAPRATAGFAALIADARAIHLLDKGSKRIAPVSAVGAGAALLYIDDKQRRVGTTSALVRRGAAKRVPPPPALPVVTVALPSAAKPPQLSSTAIARLRGEDGCGEADREQASETHRLDASASLLMIPLACASGAYNFASKAYTLDNRGRATPARFNSDSTTGDGNNTFLFNADWDPVTRRLATFFKGRGLGDCGSGHSWAWDGARFRLVKQEVMGECRGSTDYITTWRARVVDRR